MSKKSPPNTKTKRFSFKPIILLGVLVSAGFIIYDINQSGNWEKSNTLKAAKEYGIYSYATLACDKVKEGANFVDSWLQDNFPDYYKFTVDYFSPYKDLFYDLGLVSYNVYEDTKKTVIEQYPHVLVSIKSVAPDFIDQSQKVFQNAWSTSVLYFNRGVDYLKNEVFVGQFSPENVHRVVLEAFNSTQQKATEYYYWLYHKVQTMKNE